LGVLIVYLELFWSPLTGSQPNNLRQRHLLGCLFPTFPLKGPENSESFAIAIIIIVPEKFASASWASVSNCSWSPVH